MYYSFRLQRTHFGAQIIQSFTSDSLQVSRIQQGQHLFTVLKSWSPTGRHEQVRERLGGVNAAA